MAILSKRMLWAVAEQPPPQQLRLVIDQDVDLCFLPDRPRDISNWTLAFNVREKLGGTSAIALTTAGAQVVRTDTGRGIITVSLLDTDTSSLTVTTGLDDDEGYTWQLTRTDAGSETVLARGELILEQKSL
jgi:hypothetical protein